MIQKPRLVIVNGKPVIQNPTPVSGAMQLANDSNREITVLGNNNTTSLSFMKRQPAEKWKVEETSKFYMALQIFGTDFSLIEKVFDQQRTRE